MVQKLTELTPSVLGRCLGKGRGGTIVRCTRGDALPLIEGKTDRVTVRCSPRLGQLPLRNKTDRRKQYKAVHQAVQKKHHSILDHHETTASNCPVSGRWLTINRLRVGVKRRRLEVITSGWPKRSCEYAVGPLLPSPVKLFLHGEWNGGGTMPCKRCIGNNGSG